MAERKFVSPEQGIPFLAKEGISHTSLLDKSIFIKILGATAAWVSISGGAPATVTQTVENE